MTETNELTFPPDASASELNCVINKKGWRERRPGVDFITSASTLATTTIATEINKAKTRFTWTSVAGDGNKNFEVVQLGQYIYFFDHDSANPTAKVFTVDLATYNTESNVESIPVQFAANKGYLFVAGEKVNPFYVSYNATGDTISTVALTIKVRDLDGVDDGLAVDYRPTTLSANHEYNLYNQGWNTQNVKHEADGTLRTPLAHWQLQNNTAIASEGFPSNADLWWSFQSTAKPGAYQMDLQTDRVNYYVGNTPASKGYYVVSPFNIARSTVSGIGGVTSPAATTKRPQAIAAFAGRIWYAGTKAVGLSNTVYFSQLIKADDVRAAADCYQINDPTAEELNQVIDTDGGVIDISGAGVIKAMIPIETGLLIFGDNGIWLLTGPEGVFRPGDFAIKKLSGTGLDNFKSIVLVEGTPYWWDKTGIKTVGKDPSGLNIVINNISDALIKTFYDDLPSYVKEKVKGAYDPFSQKIIWLYNDASSIDLANKALVFDLRFQAFTPYEFGEARIVDVCSIPVLTTNNNDTTLEDRFRLLGFATSGANYNLKLIQFKDFTNWIDFYSIDSIGKTYLSHLETGPLHNQEFLRRKAAPNVFTMFNGVADSSCLLSTKWDYANSDVSNKYGTQFQAYRGLVNNVSQVISRHRVRGFGKSVKLRFEGETGKNFQLTGWALQYLVDDKY